MKLHDLVVIGAGPAGSSCAALAAKAGKGVILLEASRFPRDKVCGDCLNPAVWHALERLGVTEQVRALPSSSPQKIRFSVAGHGAVEIAAPEIPQEQQEFVVRRREFDALLVNRAVELGVIFQDGSPVTSLKITTAKASKKSPVWEITTSQGEILKARQVIAADGRNSAAARHLRLLPDRLRDHRIGLQTHIPYPSGYDGALEMRLYRSGYGGLVDLGNGQANLCLVANEGSMSDLRKEAETYYGLHSFIAWKSISPIYRPQARQLASRGVFLCGDAARVIEPFTGEGIAFALRSGVLLADVLTNPRDSKFKSREEQYSHLHQELYRGRLWVNRLTRFLSEHPRIAQQLGPLLIRSPWLLSKLTSKVIREYKVSS